ncbi:MAG: flagellar basal body-associated FliL family protein [Rubrivivax sp.]|nr:flagellar basal body-associated FliL family protein [Rubrivivax sp.]
MSATATADAALPPPVKGKKKLILIIAAAAFLLLAGLGVGAMLLLKQQSHGADMPDEHPAPEEHASAARDPAHPPAYVPLDPFTVNLADKQSDRYAQVAVTLELSDPATAESIKAFMPAVRNNILLTLANKTATELMEPDGKSRLAEDIQRETARALGLPVDGAPADGGNRGKRKSSGHKEAPAMPVSAVYFSTFIIQ